MEADIISPFAHDFTEIATTDDHHVVRQRALEVLHKIPEHAVKHEDIGINKCTTAPKVPRNKEIKEQKSPKTPTKFAFCLGPPKKKTNE
eukprot:5721189-Amphidinium_carterae.1